MGKQVPLVIYKSGERIIIGMASIEKDGSITAQIAKDVREDVKRLLSDSGASYSVFASHVNDISINPKVEPKLKYHEVAAIPPLKVQE